MPPQKYENFAIFKPNLRDLMHTLRYSETKKGLSPAFSVSSPSLPAFFFFCLFVLFFSFFQLPSFCVFYNLLTLLRGWFTPIGLIHVHLSLLLSSPFLSFPLSSFLFLFSLLFFFFFLSLPADFWCGDRRHAAPLPTGLMKNKCSYLMSLRPCHLWINAPMWRERRWLQGPFWPSLVYTAYIYIISWSD